MKKLLIFLASLLFASHMQTNDKDLNLALQGKYNQALQGFVKRCQNKDGYACGMVGYFYDKGFGVKKDSQKALIYYKKGCKLKDADSCTLLGYKAYKNGDLKKAKEYLDKGCKFGNTDACNYKGKLNENSISNK